MNKIFVLEDDPLRIDWFKQSFSHVDCTHKVANALDMISKNKYDIIFIDRDLSSNEENGEDFAWEMKQRKLASNTPVIIHSENHRGQRVIRKYISSYNDNVSCIPFRELKALSIDKIKKIANKEMKENEVINKEGQSVIDFLFHNPNIHINFNSHQIEKLNAAKSLFTIWQDENNKVGEKSFRKPINISSNEIERMQKEGLVRYIGDRIEITSKGSDVIKTLILGDDRSAFDNDYDTPLDITTAEANIKNSKTKRKLNRGII